MNGGANGNRFVGVHVLARFATEQFLDLFLHLGHARHAADQNHVVDLGDFDASVLDRGTAWADGAFNQFVNQGLKLGARELDAQVLGTGCVGRDVGQVDVGLCAAGEFDLGLFGRFFQALQRQHVLAQINTLVLLELGDDEVNDALVEVFATQEGVAVGGEHFKLLLAIDVGNLDDGDVKGAAAEVIDGDLAVALFILVQTEGQSGCRWLIDDALDIQAGDAPGVLGGLALGIVEVGRHRDDSLGNGFAQIVLGGLLHLAQDVGADLLCRDLFAAHLDPGVAVVGGCDLVGHQVNVLLHFLLDELASNQALDRVQGVLRIRHGLALGRGANQHFAVFLISDDGRCGARTFCVFNDLGRVAFHDGNAAVGGPQVNTDDSSHDLLQCSDAFELWIT